MTMCPVGEQQLIGLISHRCSGKAQPFEEAFALREVDRGCRSPLRRGT